LFYNAQRPDRVGSGHRVKSHPVESGDGSKIMTRFHLCSIYTALAAAPRGKNHRLPLKTRHTASTSMYWLTFRVRVTTPRSMDEMERRRCR